MITSMISRLNQKLQAVKMSSRCRGAKKAAGYVYRDDLKKTTPLPETKKVKKRVRFAETEAVVIAVDGEEGNALEEKVVRVRVRLTKEEATRMLSRCSDAGILELGDVACELMRIPAERCSDARILNQ